MSHARPGPVRAGGARHALRRGVLLATVLALGVQVTLGASWWLANVTAVPEYGDTAEYLRTATSFEVDGYRTLAYPLVVRGALEIGERLPIPWTVPLYAVQLLAAVLACAVLVRALRPAARPLVQAGWTAVLVTVPLPLHYTVVVLTDSFATSALLVLLAGLVRVTLHKDRSWRAALLVVVGAAGSVAIRPDRLYLVLALTALAALVLLAQLRRARAAGTARSLLRTLVVLVLLALVPAGAATVVNRATQTADLGREQASVLSAVFDRTVNRHLDEVADRVPPEVAAALTDPGVTNQAYAAVQAAGGEAAVRASIRAAIDCCGAQIVGESARDVAHGTLGPYTVLADWVTGGNPSAQWDLSRMSAHRPGWTAAFLAWSTATTVLLLAWTLALAVQARRRVLGLPVLAVLLPAVVVGAFFGLVTSLPPNPRYTLVPQVLLWLLPLALLAATGARRPRSTEPADEVLPVGPSAVPAPAPQG